MPFRNRCDYAFPPCSPFAEKVSETKPDGFVTHRLQIGFKPLPPCETYELSRLIKAGVPLEKTSTVIKKVSRLPLELVEENDASKKE